MATNIPTMRPSSANQNNSSKSNHNLPPKAPMTSSSRSLQEHLTITRPPRVQHKASIGSVASSVASTASDASRHSLHREVLRRRQSLTTSEYNFLQGIVANGTEVEVLLVQKKLCDPSLCFDVNDDESNNDNDNDNDTIETNPEEDEGNNRQRAAAPTVTNNSNSKTTDSTVPSLYPNPSMSLEEMDLSIDTCASGRGKPPATPIPVSPRYDQVTLTIPSHEELYPEVAQQEQEYGNNNDSRQKNMLMMPTLPIHDSEQTPLVQNLRAPKSLEGAADLPILTGDDMQSPLFLPPQQPSLAAATSAPMVRPYVPDAAALRPVVLERRTSNPLMGQLWRAHEQGFAVTPQQSNKRLQQIQQIRREHSLTSLSSPLRRYSSRHNSLGGGSLASDDNNSLASNSDERSLLNRQELRRIKQRDTRTHSQAVMMLLRNNALADDGSITDRNSISTGGDLTSLLLPTDDEIFRRAKELQQQAAIVTDSQRPDRPPPPRPFGKAKSTGAAGVPVPPPLGTTSLRRMTSDGSFVAGPPTLQRRPSALRRMTSDGSTRKSVSFNPNLHAPPTTSVLSGEEGTGRRPSSMGPPPTNGNGDATTLPLFFSESALGMSRSNDTADESLSTFDSDQHPATEIIRTRVPQREVSGLTINNDESWENNNITIAASTTSPTASMLDGTASLNLHHANPVHQESVGTMMDGTASLNLRPARPLRQDSIASTAEGWEAARAFQDQLNQQRDGVTRPILGWKDSTASAAPSLNLHMARPLATSPTSINTDDATETPKTKPSWGRMDSANSVASLNLHPARPVRQESIASTAEGWEAARAFQEDLVADASSPLSATDTLSHRDSGNSIPSLRNIRKAAPLRQESIASTAGGAEALRAFQQQFDSGGDFYFGNSTDGDGVYSLASLNLDMASPIRESIFKRQESMASVAFGGAELDAEEAFRPPGWARRESMNSLASLDLHHAHPIRQESVASNVSDRWLRRESMGSVTSHNLHRANPVRRDSMASITSGAGMNTMDAFRERVAMESWGRRESMGRRDSMNSIASLNLHHARPLRQESIASTATGWDASEALRKEFSVNPNTAVKPSWKRMDSTDSIGSLNVRPTYPVVSNDMIIDILRNQGSAFSQEDDFAASLRSLPAGESAMESMASIPSLHPAFPVRMDSIVSTAAGREARDNLCSKFGMASVVASEWEGVVSPDEWEDKKCDDDVLPPVIKVKGRDVPRPVFMRRASASEYDEEGMEVAPLEEESTASTAAPSMKLKTQIIVPDHDAAYLPVASEPALDVKSTTKEAKPSPQIFQRLPGNLSRRQSIEMSASFDESKSVDRFRGVFRGEIPRSISEDDLSVLFSSQCSK